MGSPKKPFLNNDGFSKFAFWFGIAAWALSFFKFLSFIAFPFALIALLRKKGGKILWVPVVITAAIMLSSMLGRVNLFQKKPDIALPQFDYSVALEEDIRRHMLYPYSEKDFESLAYKETALLHFNSNTKLDHDATAKHVLTMECRNGIVDYDMEISFQVDHFKESGWEDPPQKAPLYYYDFALTNTDPSGLVGTWVNEEPIQLTSETSFDLILCIESAQVAKNGNGLSLAGTITSVYQDQSKQGVYSFKGEYPLDDPLDLNEKEVISGDDMRNSPVIDKTRYSVYVDAEGRCLAIKDQWSFDEATKMKKI